MSLRPRPAPLAAALALCAATPAVAAAAQAGPAASSRPGLLRALDASLEQVIARVAPAVVQVRVTGYGPSDEDGAPSGLIVRQHAIGSGIVVTPDGFVVTNAHVVAGAQRVRVVLPEPTGPEPAKGGKRIFDARVVGQDPEIDLALLKIDAAGLPSLPIARRDVRPGQLVFAVGSPQGLASTVTMGVVSSVARQPDPEKPMLFIQTDAPINPGNSGGPLVDTEGNVVGVNTFILTQGGGSEGLGFAIPSAVVRFVYDSLRRSGHVHHTVIGLAARPVTPVLAAALALPQDWGVVVADVLPGSPAAAAGIAPCDVLVSLDGHAVDAMPALASALYTHPPETPVALVLRRGDRTLKLLVKGVEPDHAADRLAELTDIARSAVPRLGIVGVTIDDRIRQRVPDLREPTGVVVVGRTVEGAQLDAGLEPGDVIHAVNRTEVRTVDELRAAVKALPEAGPGVLRVERHGELSWIELDLE